MRRRAFTLVEVLIAIALMIALVGSMFAFLWDTLATRERMTVHAARRRSATTLFDRLERDLVTVIAADPAAGAGVQGDAASLRLLVRAVPARLADMGANRALVDLESVEYRFDRAAQALGLRRSARGAGESGELHQLEGAVTFARFRYYDGSQWRDEFSSEGGAGLPLAIEIAVWYEWAPPADDDADAFDDEAIEPDRGDEGGFLGFGRVGRSSPTEEPAVPDTATEFPPLPDRIRVIALPDAQAPDSGEVS